MEQKVDFDCRPYVALGVVLVMGILAMRMPVESTENAFNHLVNAAFRVQPLSLACGHYSPLRQRTQSFRLCAFSLIIIGGK